jgi:hypothetical protein
MTVEEALRALAGFFVLVSLALGFWVHPGFFLLTAFVGANLLQSGFTNACPAMWIFRKLGLKDAAGGERAPLQPPRSHMR